MEHKPRSTTLSLCLVVHSTQWFCVVFMPSQYNQVACSLMYRIAQHHVQFDKTPPFGSEVAHINILKMYNTSLSIRMPVFKFSGGYCQLVGQTWSIIEVHTQEGKGQPTHRLPHYPRTTSKRCMLCCSYFSREYLILSGCPRATTTYPKSMNPWTY